MPGLRETLASKKPNITRYPVSEDAKKAERELREAAGRLDLIKLVNARRKADEPKVDTKVAEAEVRKAQQRYEKVSGMLVFRGLTPVERDALATEFTPAEEDAEVDLRGYTGALVALAAMDSDLTREEWDAELYESGRWSAGEVEVLRATARAAYEEAPGSGIPKG